MHYCLFVFLFSFFFFFHCFIFFDIGHIKNRKYYKKAKTLRFARTCHTIFILYLNHARFFSPSFNIKFHFHAYIRGVCRVVRDFGAQDFRISRTQLLNCFGIMGSSKTSICFAEVLASKIRPFS